MPTQSSRQTLFIALAVVSLVVVEGFVIVGGRLADEALNLRKHTHETLVAISEVNERKDHTESLVREFVVTGGEPLALRAEKDSLEIHERLAHARRLMGDDTNQVRRLDRLDATLKELTTRWATTLATRRTQGKDPAQVLVAEGIGRRLTDEAEFILDEMKAEENRLLAERGERAERLSGYSMAASQIVGVLTVLFGFLALRTLRASSNALRQLNESLEQRVQARTAELQLERGKLAATFENMELGVVVSNAQGNDIVMNAAAERMHGFASRADMHAKLKDYANEWELRDATGRVLPFAEWPLPRAVCGDFCRDWEIHLRNLKSGHEWDCSYTAVPVRDDKGQVSLLVLTLVDITARKQAEQEIRTLNASLEQRVAERTAQLNVAAAELRRSASAIEAMRDAVFMFAPDTLQFYFVNRGAREQVGYTEAELLQMTPLSIKPQFTEAQFREMVAPLLDGREQVLNFTTVHRHKDGTDVPVEINLQMATEAGQRCFVALSRDVSERQRAEQQLAENNRKLAEFKDALDAHAIVAITDARGKITYVNDAFCAISKYSREELVGQDHRIINSGHHPKDFIRGLWETITSGRVWKGEIKNRAKDGSGYWVDTTIVPFLGADGKPAQFIAIRADISKRKLAEETLRAALTELSRANAELDDASRHKDEFLANMSHELRTPLNAILGLSEALLEQTNATLTPRQVKSVTTISTSGQHLLALINDILDLSKIEAGKLELHAEPLNVDEFCQSCLVFVRTQAMQKQIYVDHQRDPRPLVISADPKRLKQILVNLLTNAVKFTPEGGRIGLSVSAPEGEDVMRFTVWDTGIGIAAEDQTKLFQTFSQVDSGLNRAQEGTGLGLALVARLVELHGGSVILDSEPGKGSRFIVTLPLSMNLKPEHPSPALRAPSPLLGGGERDGVRGALRSGSGAEMDEQSPRRDGKDGTRGACAPQTFKHALVIEDDPTVGEQLVHYLTLLGMKSALHVRGAESVEAALREKPDVILLDILLPNESGWVVLARLKEHPATRDIPVVVVSVVDEPEKSRAMGAAAHFTKPVTREQLAKFLGRPVVVKQSDTQHFRRPTPIIPSGPSILLAEDNEANIQTIGGYLEDKGYTMHYATNGLSAVKLAHELRPALILMDIQMPTMDGLTATKKLREDAAFKVTPIIALTALAMSGDRERCLAAGATDYMSKPVKLKELAALVERLLPRTGKGGGI